MSTDGKIHAAPKGILEEHPSIGKHVRDPIEGPSWPTAKDHGGGRMVTPPVEIIWGILLAAWVIYSRLFYVCPYFRDSDAARLAFGISQRLQSVAWNMGDFFELQQQQGTYLVFELLARIFSVPISGLGHFMALTCAIFMIGIIVLSYSLGFMIWGRRVALVSTTILSISPMMWITGEYPTALVPAFFFFMLAVWAMVMSYRLKGGRWWLVASALLFAWSIIMRLEMIFGILVPLCYAFFVDRRGLRRALILYIIVAVALFAYWAFILRSTLPEIFALGPQRPDYPGSLMLNWWGMGPFLFLFAFAGFVYRFVTDRKPLPFIFFWIIGFNTFYTGHLTSPEFFIAYYPVVGWLAAFAIIALYSWLVKIVRFNRPLRLVFMLLLVIGALSMLTTSIIKDGDGQVRITWGETAVYKRGNDNFPTGSAWFFMQDFRQGKGMLYDWMENGTRRMADELLSPDSESFYVSHSPLYIGSESQAYLNYFLMADGWLFDSTRGPFVNFTNRRNTGEGAGTDEWQPPLIVQTIFQGDEVVNELGVLSNPSGIQVMIGLDAMPHFVDNEGRLGMPSLVALYGWHKLGSYDGFDVITPGMGAGQSDGTVDCERELYRFFHTDSLPRNHVDLTDGESTSTVMRGRVTSHDGKIQEFEERKYLDDILEAEWTIDPTPHRWLALAINRAGLLPQYSLEVNGQILEDPLMLASNLPGYIRTQWDIVLISPEILDSPEVNFRLESVTRGDIYDIYWVQRNYPDCQYRNQTAGPLGLQFADIDCIR